ncbi:uncharacterized protein LOC133485831 [Phyllopteryx taeniolatus]|uniref:uncharacterized protein LOC133485831 n=1 Tax=Phyllopteryx taeniolatus TaxID=161469 RepID=UPI002AD49AA0|nr:uncharacterized protein LOC133485831 [Phyllopteryx taeniolatus]
MTRKMIGLRFHQGPPLEPGPEVGLEGERLVAGPAPMGLGREQPERVTWVHLPVGPPPVGGAIGGGDRRRGPWRSDPRLQKLALGTWNVTSLAGKEPEPDGYQLAKRNAPLVVAEAKTRAREDFGEAMEKDLRTASRKFWSTLRRLRRGKQCTANTVCSGDGAPLTSTRDVVSRWGEYFEDLLNSTDTPSHEEAESGVSEVTEVVKKLLFLK